MPLVSDCEQEALRAFQEQAALLYLECFQEEAWPALLHRVGNAARNLCFLNYKEKG